MASTSSDKASSTSADIGPLRDQIQDLYTAVEKTLRQNIFDNTGRMGSMRLVPATSRQIVDTCLGALAGDTEKSEVADHLAELTRRGLGPQTALAVADSLYWTSLELLEATPATLSALRPAIEAYRQQFLYQYMQARADQIITTREDAYQNISAALEKQITLEQHLRLDLERQQEQLAKRAIELETVAQVSTAVTTILEGDRLLQEVADLTKERFALYHTHIYLLNEREDTLDLAAGADEVGRQMKAQGWQIPLKQKHSLVARAVRSRQGVVVNDVRQAPDFLPNPLLPDTRSELAVPLIAGDQVLGVLDVQADEVNYFTDEDVRIQTTLAAQVAVALQNAARYEETQRALNLTEQQAHRLSQLNELSAQLHLAETEEDIFNVAARQVAQIFDGSRGSVALLTEKGDQLSVSALQGDAVIPLGENVPVENTAVGLAVQENRIVVVSDFQADDWLDYLDIQKLAEEGLHSCMDAPLVVGGEVIGTLNVGSHQLNPYTAADVGLMQQLVSLLSSAIENRRLFAQVQQALTEQRRLTADLETQRGTLQAVLQSIPAGVFVAEAPTGKPLLANERAQEILGRGIAPDATTEALAEVYDAYRYGTDELYPAQEMPLVRGMFGESITIDDMEIRRPDGNRIALQVFGAPIYNAAGEVTSSVAIFQDITEHRGAEAERERLLAETQQSQQLLRTIIDATPDWIFIKDQEYRYRLVNQSYADALHLKPEDFIGKNDLELGFPEELVKGNPERGIRGFWTDDRQVLESGEPLVNPYDPATIDDEMHIFHTIKTPLRDAEGQVESVLAFARDVTERERLLAEVQRLAVIVENHPDFVGVGTLDGQALYVNPAGLKMMGLPPDHDVTTMDAYDFYPAADAEMLTKKGLPVALETGSWTAEANLLKVDGATVPVEETLGINYDAEGKPHSFSITMRDITERKETEEELQKFKFGIERSSDAVFLTEVDGTIVYVNSAFEEIYGYNREEALGQTPRILKSGVISPEVYEQFWETLLAGEVVAGEIVNKTKDGRLLEIEGNNNPILDEEGNLVGFLSIHRDITERKEAEAERERLLAEVEAAYRQYIQREWTQFLGEQQDDHWHIEHQQPGVPDESNGQILGVVQDEVRREGKSKTISGGNDNGHQVEPAIVTPISLRGEVIGTLSLQDIDPERQWTADELALVETVSEQLALTLENLRLFDQTQKRAGREQLTRQITDKMRASPDIESIIQTGLKELAAALGVSRTYVKLSPEPEHGDINE